MTWGCPTSARAEKWLQENWMQKQRERTEGVGVDGRSRRKRALIRGRQSESGWQYGQFGSQSQVAGQGSKIEGEIATGVVLLLDQMKQA